jgi:aspartyl protease family protein
MRPPHNRSFKVWLLALALALCAMPWVAVRSLAEAERVDVAEELERLMAVHGFTMKPAQLEATRHSIGRAEGDALVPRLRMLLERFDHVIVQRPDGTVDRVIILGEKSAASAPPPEVTQGEGQATEAEAPKNGEASPAAEIVVETQRKGTSHALMLSLEGEKGIRIERPLLLDTGADYVVLPSSLLKPLGMRPENLRRQAVQTANGPVEAQLGTLTAVWFGNQRVSRVATAFIDDSRLGGNALLGMSVLGRFRVTIDDAKNQVVLTP